MVLYDIELHFHEMIDIIYNIFQHVVSVNDLNNLDKHVDSILLGEP